MTYSADTKVIPITADSEEIWRIQKYLIQRMGIRIYSGSLETREDGNQWLYLNFGPNFRNGEYVGTKIIENMPGFKLPNVIAVVVDGLVMEIPRAA